MLLSFDQRLFRGLCLSTRQDGPPPSRQVREHRVDRPGDRPRAFASIHAPLLDYLNGTSVPQLQVASVNARLQGYASFLCIILFFSPPFSGAVSHALVSLPASCVIFSPCPAAHPPLDCFGRPGPGITTDCWFK